MLSATLCLQLQRPNCACAYIWIYATVIQCCLCRSAGYVEVRFWKPIKKQQGSAEIEQQYAVCVHIAREASQSRDRTRTHWRVSGPVFSYLVDISKLSMFCPCTCTPGVPGWSRPGFEPEYPPKMDRSRISRDWPRWSPASNWTTGWPSLKL